jgi:ATP-dependent helicase/nuclease subunit A
MADLPAEHAFTASQEAAVERRSGPLLLSASAGAGKTSVLVERFVRAVLSDGVAPSRILVVTFTERAAAELGDRVRARLLALGDPAAASEAEAAPISTFHSFCARLLRTNPLAAGLDHDFTVLDGPSADRLSQLAFRAAFADLLAGERRPEAIDVAAAFSFDRFRRIVTGAFAEQRSRGIVRPSLLLPALDAEADPADLAALRACSLIDTALGLFADRWSALKRSRSALDFDDLELCAIDLLRSHPDLRSTLSSHFELLMVDEFQDTNRRQLSLLELLERDNLFTVGDEFQSIYGFRFADPSIFRARRRALSASGAALSLADNFRSLPPLISLVNAVFSPRFGESFTPLVASRPDGEGLGEAVAEAGKEAAGEAPEDGPLVELLLTDTRGWADSPHAPAIAGTLPPAPLWRQAEARLLAGRLCELVASGAAAPGDVAVLLRAAGDLPVYEQAMVEQGLAVLASAGGFWGDPQVGDLLAWLRALANPLDSAALFSVLASPLVGLSSDGLALIALSARASRAGAWGAISGEVDDLLSDLPPADREPLSRFADFFADERRLLPTRSLAGLLSRAVSLFAYDAHLLSLPFGEQRLADVHKLIALARGFEEASGRDLRGFLDDAAHRAAFAAGSEPHAPVDSAPDAVRLMTIHASKGLEFPLVCLADLGRAPVSMAPDLLLDADGDRIGLRLAGLDGSPPVEALGFAELREERRALEAAEEERIVYVAVTRARDRLILSGAFDFAKGPKASAGSRTTAGNQSKGGGAPGAGGPPINWLVPALSPDLPALAAAREAPVVDLALAGVPVRCRLNGPSTFGEVLHNAICP